MTHIFISYSSKHRELTEELAAFFERCGLEVFWDRELAARLPFEWQLNEKLRTASCVVVLWTPGGLTSDWVKREADYGYDNGSAKNKLVSVTVKGLDWSELPPPYNTFEHHRPFETDLILRDVLAVREGRLLLEDKREELPEVEARTPTMLLQAKFGLVPFKGGAAVRDDLLDWALGRSGYTAEQRRAAGRLIHGPGGLGKTRLLIEVAEALRAEGWSAGFLARPGTGDKPEDTPEVRAARRDRQAKALGHLIRGASDKGLLLVIDYAEGRNDEIRDLAAHIQSRPADDTRPIRLVLLTRGAGDWWTRLVENDQVTRALFGDERLDVHALTGIVTPKDRLDLFNAAVAAFAPKLVEMKYAMPIESIGPPESWEATRALAKRLEGVERNVGYSPGEGYDRPLAIAMEALLYLAAMAPGANEPGVHGLLANILGLERDHWPKLVPLRDEKGVLVAKRVADLERAVGQVTGLQGVEGRPAAEALFMADRYYEGQRPNRASVREVTDNVSKIYGRGDVIAQLEPDLIGEHHVALTADEELLDGCMAWIDTAPKDRQELLRRDLLTVLQRATRPEHGPAGVERACMLLDHLIRAHGGTLGADMVKVMGDTPGALFDRLQAQVEALPEPALAAINFALPANNLIVSWMDFSLRVAERYAELARKSLTAAGVAKLSSEGQERLRYRAAAAFDTLSIRYSNLKRLDDALAASEEAVKIRRELYRAKPDVFAEVLATSLNNISVDYSNLKRLDDALAASEEAVKIRRELYRAKPDVFGEDLALSLSVMSDALRALQRSAEGAAATREGLMAILPALEAGPELHRDRAGMLAREHLEASKEAGQEPDMPLLQRVAASMGAQRGARPTATDDNPPPSRL